MNIDLSILNLFKQIGVPSSAFDPSFSPVTGDGKAGVAVPGASARTEYGAVGNSPYYAIGANGREYYLPVTITYPVSSPTMKEGAGVPGM
jgi:hypothetical protein